MPNKHASSTRYLSKYAQPSLTLGLALLMASVVLVSGCATIGEDFPKDQVSVIEVGETTQDEVREMFGEPWRTGIENGQRTWTYAKYRYSLFSAAKTDDLVVRFDDAGKVTSYTFNTTDKQE